MRMDNETYRFRVEDLLKGLQDEDGTWNTEIQEQLEELALVSRKARYFLKALNDQPVPVQVHFLRYVMARTQGKDADADLERHIRHRFYEAREEIKQVLAELDDPTVLPALFRVIALTEEGWLAGELIRLALTYDAKNLKEPVDQALKSGDYLLQCLAIYLTGKSKHDRLLDVLAKFYRKPFGEKVDRLERKTYDALMEGMEECSEQLILRWLRDGNARVRDLGITAVSKRRLPAAVPDLVRLLLIDAKTRGRAATTLLELQSESLLSFAAEDAASEPVREIVSTAKQEPLVSALRALLRDDTPAVREVAVKLAGLVPDYEELHSQVGRLATEERSRTVQLSAVRSLALMSKERFVNAAVEILAEGVGPHEEVADVLRELTAEILTEEERDKVRAEVADRRQRRDAALDKFASTVEWWRHDI